MQTNLQPPPGAHPFATPAPGAPVEYSFHFTGAGAEYFRIWLVNVLLSIATLGIYSAWAKVRSKQYFYANTRLDGASFEYTASPISILIGRIIVLTVIAAADGLIFLLLTSGYVAIPPIIALMLLLVTPWAAIHALKFNARYSSHRSLHFGFDGRYPRAFVVFLLLPALTVLTAGLLVPFTAHALNRFVVDNHRYGNTCFTFEGTPRGFYIIYLKAFAIALAVGASIAGALSLVVNPGSGAGLFAVGAAAAIGFIAASAFLRTVAANYTWTNTRIRDNRFALRLEFWPMLWILTSNLLLIVLTLGLWIPFAKVRTAQYFIERLTLHMTESPDDFAAGRREDSSALGDEFGEAFNLDSSLLDL